MSGAIQSGCVQEMALGLWRSGAAFYRQAAGQAGDGRCRDLLLNLADWEERQAESRSQAASSHDGASDGMSAGPLQPLLCRVQEKLYGPARQRRIAEIQDGRELLLRVIYVQDIVGFLLQTVAQSCQDASAHEVACDIIEQHQRYVRFLHQHLTRLENGGGMDPQVSQDQTAASPALADSLRA